MAGWTRPLKTELGLTPVLELPHLEISLLRLAQGERFDFTALPRRETAVVFASGRVAATAGGRFWANAGTSLKAAPWTSFLPRTPSGPALGALPRPRRRISPEFRPLVHTSPWPLHQLLYLPPDTPVELQALEAAEMLFAATALPSGCSPPETDLHGPFPDNSREIGYGAHRRLVTPSLLPGSGSVCLSIGETYNPPGGWSTYPPHRHDRRETQDGWTDGPRETQHEEIYVFRFAPSSGFGMARLYGERAPGLTGSDQALVFQHADALAIAQGYHTVCAAPGYHLHYLWAIAGPRAEASRARPDRLHTWVDEEP
ncbi:MAG: 5-deoxy-glucuronate isomerase [Bacillota bacterium]|nr:5-deoxy-glucuronate isomerase [Bacillota bacterium]